MSEAKRKPKIQPRREKILDEAIRMLGEHGFKGLTVQALAERCDISNAGLLYYFRSKDDLLLAVLDEFEAREREALKPLFERIEAHRGDPEQTWLAIVELLHEMVARFASKPDLARLLYVLQAEALDHTHIAHDWFGKREDMTLELLTSLLDRFVPDATATGRRLAASMHGLGQHWLRRDMSFNLLEEWRALSALVLAPQEAAADRRGRR